MKKARYDYSTTTITATVTARTHDITNGAEKLAKEPVFPNPPSEETVARLNAIAREYPFCVSFKHKHHTVLL